MAEADGAGQLPDPAAPADATRPGGGRRMGVSPTPSESEAMSSDGLQSPKPAAADEALLLQPSSSSMPMKPVYSSDSLMALAAQESFSGLGTAGGGPAYPHVPPPRMMPASGDADGSRVSRRAPASRVAGVRRPQPSLLYAQARPPPGPDAGVAPPCGHTRDVCSELAGAGRWPLPYRCPPAPCSIL